MTKFHEGQEVEVYYPFSRSNEATWPWCKGKIVHLLSAVTATFGNPFKWLVQFPDGTRHVFAEEHIRAVNLRVSSNDPTGTRPMNRGEIDKWWLSDFAAYLDEQLEAEGKP
jgi:hypothetical protein